MPFYPQPDEPLSVMDNALQEPTGFDVSLPEGTNPEPLQQQPSVWDAAFRQNNLLAGMFRPAKQFEPADGYNPYSDKNELKGYEQWGSAFADSKSPEETAWIKNQIDDENEDRRVLSEAGAEGTLASIAAGIIDPVTVASMFIPGAQGSLAARIGSQVAIGAAGTALSEVALNNEQYTRTARESAAHITAGALLSGVFATAGAMITPSVRNAVTREVAEALDNMNASPTINNAADALADTLPNGGSVGAMRIREATLEDLTPVSGGPLGKLAKKAGMKPHDLAELFAAELAQSDGIKSVEVAGPGFINLFLAPSFWAGVVLGACSNKEYGRTDHGKGAKYNVEFVSANPTGPMHMGNARGGALGDCLAAVLDWSGYDVTREFYINDAGNQIQKFGKSLAVRYLQKYCGEEAYPLPAECYQGGDIKVLAGEFAELNGDKYVASCKGMDEETLFESEAFAALKDALVAYALPKNIAALKRDLGKYRIDYDVWFHESTLHESGAVLAVVDKLLELGACYKAEDGAIMYRSAQYAAKYGTVNKKKTDDGTEEEAKDEVLVRANGIPTYFAADIAYHYNKLATRGFAKAIDVWGADHHGHVARMKGAMDAIGLHGEDLDVVLMQMVNLMRDGQPVRMSKRTGNAITLTDLLEEVPIDSARFLFNMHDAGSGIDFDLDQAVKTDNDNPVYYVQYAHARICSILKKMESEGVAFAGAENIDATLLTEPSEMDLIRMLAAFPQEIVMAAEKYDPSRINRFVIDLASAFHRFYGSCRIQGADPAVQQARLALCIGVKNVIFNVLTMFKINVPEKM